MIVCQRATVREPRKHENSIAVVFLFVQQMEGEPLLLIAIVELVFNETRCRCELLGQWRDTFQNLFIVGFFVADLEQVFNILRKVVDWIRH